MIIRMRLAARAPPPPILKLGVLVHAFVAAAGVLQNGKLRQCNFAVVFSEGIWQFLIVRCGCSLCRYLPISVLKHCKKHQQWLQNLQKIHPKTIPNRPKWCPGALQKWSWKQVGFSTKKKTLLKAEIGRFLAPLGRFGAQFWAPAEPDGGPKITHLRKNAT